MSGRDQTVKMGASADWWMTWTVNGKQVYTTLPQGNGSAGSPTGHVFDIPLKKGRNIIAVKVLAGSQGWVIQIADPDMGDGQVKRKTAETAHRH